ncbi:hypothetical protein XFF6166_10266 [Xanthomonas citri pv. fuscans]|nr:hypothetical protein XFF6166_10266 [Xanthomonas citri pv. fuscans]SOO06858.1 hypothetical protein XFF7767_80268 [Xanthomonas citri pv. fuscans]SOO16412.1 hypothetical protein XFF7766_770266 [Xanthomonas citri pv. fuscans]SOO45705.1 hypothetical protein XFF1815_900044 [Xanthomonas citri pv. fuscans]
MVWCVEKPTTARTDRTAPPEVFYNRAHLLQLWSIPKLNIQHIKHRDAQIERSMTPN